MKRIARVYLGVLVGVLIVATAVLLSCARQGPTAPAAEPATPVPTVTTPSPEQPARAEPTARVEVGATATLEAPAAGPTEETTEAITVEDAVRAAQAAVEAGNLEEARQVLEQALAGATEIEKAQIQDILVDMEKGEIEEVEEHLAAMLEGAGVETFLHEAQEALAAGDLEKARHELQQALEMAAGVQREQIEDILSDLDKGDLDEVEEHLAALLAETGQAKEVSLSGEAAEGHELYVQVGCSACHGQNAEGGLGPALAGHTREQVLRQVRSPIGQMPPFPPERLSDEDLEKIAAYIVSLGPPQAGHKHGVEISTPEQIHHLMAVLAIQAGNLEDAAHHVRHALEFNPESEHKQQMEQALAMLEAGEAHEAEHLLQEMVGTLAGEENHKTLAELHLELALAAVEQGDVAEAQHQIGHFLEVATGQDKETGEEIMTFLNARDLEAAEGHIRELLGGGAHSH